MFKRYIENKTDSKVQKKKSIWRCVIIGAKRDVWKVTSIVFTAVKTKTILKKFSPFLGSTHQFYYWFSWTDSDFLRCFFSSNTETDIKVNKFTVSISKLYSRYLNFKCFIDNALKKGATWILRIMRLLLWIFVWTDVEQYFCFLWTWIFCLLKKIPYHNKIAVTSKYLHGRL